MTPTARKTDTYVTNGDAAVMDAALLPDGPFALPVDGEGLTIPLLEYILMDGTRHTVQALNPDLMLWEDTAAKHRWPGPSQAPFRWLTFLSWAAARRTGAIPQSLTWEVFSPTVAQVRDVGKATANPTQPGVVTG